MKYFFLITCFLLLTSCSNEQDLKKQYYSGIVLSSLAIESHPSDDKIKSVSVRLNSGKLINVFTEGSFVLENGISVRVFNYSDGSKMYYLDKTSITQ